ncbi:MepB family protein [Arthrobacter sp. HS15c]|uniref:MepB family protein n=1 Tax=Arthrobacter sp. HS15c TaxID=3230279 RepID=UPI0034677DF2
MPLPPDLLATTADFLARGFAVSEPHAEAESLDYGAHTFRVNGLAAAFRIARKTPKKAGRFVTLWQRTAAGAGPIRPFDSSDGFGLFVVSAGSDDGFGYFAFPQETLFARGIVSQDFVGGKRALRVYPPGSSPTNRTAQATQRWQLEFYFPGNPPGAPAVNPMHGRFPPSLGEGRHEHQV